ncbi:hypothetical protein HID58_072792 [Brassica napus]|uniref:Uncharacterized protein n=1 Tax=Brassica napus TaxID=3708 RepID=A0ABQ7Z5F6_BRANA|nr:hypothetical protein HID58_072792 [Brassica napus]
MDQPEFVSSSVPKDPSPAASLPPAVIPSPSPIVPVSPGNGRVTVEYDLNQLKPPQKRSFRFFAHLNDHPEFSALIKFTWNALPFYGSKQLCVSKKLKELKPIIRSSNKENFSNLEKRVDEAFSDLTSCQSASLSSPCPVTAESERIARLKWLTLARAEDKFLKQRSRIQWNVEGDANTPFYHRVIKARQNQNHIHLLTDEHGNIIDSLEGIK